jgi:hypothetical protein
MKLALEELGLGPCHHMTEVIASPTQTATWRAIARGEGPGWDEAYEGYRSAVDWPTAFYWRELGAHFPDAKIVLTYRSPESWYESFAATLLPAIRASTEPESLGVTLIRDRVFGGRIEDRDHVIAVFERNVRDVQAALPPERLLTYEVGSGWEPLCRFLQLPVPPTPFPRSNAKDDFAARFKR